MSRALSVAVILLLPCVEQGLAQTPSPRLVRRTGTLPTPVPAYAAVDARCGWQIHQARRLSNVGHHLLDESHPESGAAPGRAEVQRGLLAAVRWRP